jgi:NADPH:quinone reductase-like Zn-dependent oxidoreductase
MRTYQICRFGIDGLKLAELSEPKPGPRDVLVRWHAWSLNYRDLLLVEGNYTRDLPCPSPRSLMAPVKLWQSGTRS